MSVTLYMDVHVPGPITRQLRRRGVDVLTAQEDGRDAVGDDQLLARATELSRVVFTHDIRFACRRRTGNGRDAISPASYSDHNLAARSANTSKTWS